MAPQARFNMADSYLAIVGRQGGGKSCRGVALDQHHVGLKAMASVLHRIQHARGQRVQRLIGTHDIQIKIRLDLEKLQGMVKHRAMLTSVNYRCLKFMRALAQGVNHQRQFDCFRPRAEDRDDPTLHGNRLALLLRWVHDPSHWPVARTGLWTRLDYPRVNSHFVLHMRFAKDYEGHER